jgi:rhodanese-related sulfurtransferase
MTPAEAERHLAAGALVIDVRSAAEYRRGHLPGAIHVPFWAAAFRPLPAVEPGAPVLVYCGHGPRASMASVAFRARGLSHVCLLEGHFAEWRRQGRPVVVSR